VFPFSFEFIADPAAAVDEEEEETLFFGKFDWLRFSFESISDSSSSSIVVDNLWTAAWFWPGLAFGFVSGSGVSFLPPCPAVDECISSYCCCSDLDVGSSEELLFGWLEDDMLLDWRVSLSPSLVFQVRYGQWHEYMSRLFWMALKSFEFTTSLFIYTLYFNQIMFNLSWCRMLILNIKDEKKYFWRLLFFWLNFDVSEML